jgi:glycine betaine/proline transport system substrate-binding protein
MNWSGRWTGLKKPHPMLLALCLLLAVLHAAPSAAQAAPIRIGWTAWSDAEFVTKLAKRLIETRLGHKVELTLVDIALQYQGVAKGDLDAMLMAWLPDTHADYQERFADRVIDLGPIYTGARLGWVVPTYVPEKDLSKISDLSNPENASRLNWEIYGIDPGSGLMRLSENALRTYRLERYNLIASSGAAMTAMVERAYRRRKWIVATAWRPHWMFHTWNLRFLDDPKSALGGREHVHALIRKGFGSQVPDVFDFLTRMYLPLDDLEAAMADARNTSYDAAISKFIAANPKRISYWLTGKLH